jgi:uncharacterized protein (DUF2126 family)
LTIRRGADAAPAAAARDQGADFDRAVAAHDAAIAAAGLDIWIGNEPTFTDRHSQATEWLTGAVGEDKRRRAESLVAALARVRPGDVILRSVGRQYPGESEPRTSLGLYGRRDGSRCWAGPPDPLLAPPGPPPDIGALDARLERALAARGLATRRFAGAGDRRQIVARPNPATPLPGPDEDERLLRPSIHTPGLPPERRNDPLAPDGLFLLILEVCALPGGEVACIELPAVAEVALFLVLLEAVGEAAAASGLPSLILRGCPPPVDPTVRWATVTPDPAVVEVNAAPQASVAAFLEDNRSSYGAAAALGLAPYRLYYNGEVADSGGGGQITFGGPTPTRSPFFVEPRLLPRLVRYLARHPSLSYLFAHDYVGPFGQSVRPDELGADVLAELRLALALLARVPAPTPPTIWGALAPFLTDASGNSHRAEINVEKLWNVDQPCRGLLGLVEFRALRMQHTPERAAALGALLRAILARLMITGDVADRLEIIAWGGALHDRFALPFYLEADLREVLADLEAAGFGLGPALVGELGSDAWRVWAALDVGDYRLEIRRALEFWFLLGDTTKQQGTSRLVDSSTSRIEVSLRPRVPGGGAGGLARWRIRANDVELPLRAQADARGPVRVGGVRYRRFDPRHGLHPTLQRQTPVRLLVLDPFRAAAHEITLHEWSPDGADYDGVPADLAVAADRRAARCVYRRLAGGAIPPEVPAPPGALGDCTLDLRYARPASDVGAEAIRTPSDSAAASGEP